MLSIPIQVVMQIIMLSNSLYFFPFSCQSYIGRVSSGLQPQDITLGPGCLFFPTIVHEIGHAIGFYHEHSRPDRDEYISVVEENVFPGFLSAFNTIPDETANLLNLGYDYASIMHYSPDTFAIPGTEVIISTKPNIIFGDAAELSPLDVAKTNALYQCGKQRNKQLTPLCL